MLRAVADDVCVVSYLRRQVKKRDNHREGTHDLRDVRPMLNPMSKATTHGVVPFGWRVTGLGSPNDIGLIEHFVLREGQAKGKLSYNRPSALWLVNATE